MSWASSRKSPSLRESHPTKGLTASLGSIPTWIPPTLAPPLPTPGAPTSPRARRGVREPVEPPPRHEPPAIEETIASPERA
ncbi:hypothetical protein [Sorangium sp. So ce176]|uniref:hypothetical protein n=1 Tax=Sorangium sp. So ce176 TaxID=3133286 RepID=UPI003F5DEAD7